MLQKPSNNAALAPQRLSLVQRFLLTLRGNTLSQVKSSLKRVYRTLHQLDSSDDAYLFFDYTLLTPQDLKQMLADLQDKYSLNTYNVTVAILRKFYQFAWLSGVIPKEHYESLCEFVLKSIRHETKAGRYIPNDIRLQIYNAIASGLPSNKSMRDLVLFYLLSHALRISETIKLTFADVEFASQYLYVRQSKGNKDRKVPLVDEALAVLQDWQERRNAKPKDYIICPVDRTDTVINRKMTRAAAHNIVKSWSDAVGFDFKTHDFRRTRITDYWSANVPATTIARIVGHSNITTTQRYDRSDDDAMFRATQSVHLF
ncbi:MAG: tyrosine recombinase XerC [Patescibacteria group bacterium]|nr:MAG: tyrosine recombinase XerC [Patescibacteria group bacterium]